MKIGALAKATGTLVDTIRFYEKEGLLAEPARTGANYREYGEAHVARLSFIRHCRSLDMTLDEIRALLRFKDDPVANCGAANELLDEHIGHVAERIGELEKLQAELLELRARCDAAGAACGILETLDRLGNAEPRRRRAHVHGSHGRHGRA